jgi:hypothetical protein
MAVASASAAGALAFGFVLTFTAVLIRHATLSIREQPDLAGYVWLDVAVYVAFVAAGTLLLLEQGQRGNGALLVAPFVLPAAANVVTAEPSAQLIVFLVAVLGLQASLLL